MVANLYYTDRARLADSADMTRAVFEQATDAIFVLDPARDRILDVNAGATRMLGYTRPELLARPISAIHPREMPLIAAFAESVIARGGGFTERLSCVTKSGDSIPAEVSAVPIRSGAGCHLIAIARPSVQRFDATRSGCTHERLHRACDAQASHSNRALDSVLAAHSAEQTSQRLWTRGIVGASVALDRVLRQIERVARTGLSVLIVGESGTGKELSARAVHAASNRAARAMVRVNCAAIARGLFESEFFGHVKGAFTGALQHRVGRFELADGGTLFLDEVAEIPFDMQSKLLRVLQEGQLERVGDDRSRHVDVRIIAATNRDLAAATEHGEFRKDLFYRLNVFPIEVPPLRQRAGDIRLLARHRLRELALQLERPSLTLTEDAYARLEAHSWPGNVRELYSVLERTAVMSAGNTIAAAQLLFDERARRHRALAIEPHAPAPAIFAEPERRRRDRANIITALRRTNGKVSGPGGAAELLGVKHTTLESRIKSLGIDKSRCRSSL